MTADDPKILYHYTTAQGLLGILESNVLWASDLSYVNDFSELKYTEKLIKDEWTKAAESDPDLMEPALGNPFSQNVNLKGGFLETKLAAYAVSFCVEGDQLSQWRAYAQKGTGYAVGFDTEQLRSAQAVLGEVVYQPDEQIRGIRPAIQKYVEDIGIWRKNLSTFEKDQLLSLLVDLIKRFLRDTFPLFFFFKDPVFSEEREWRLVAPRAYGDVENVHFREMQGTVVPYIQIKIPTPDPIKKDRLPMVEVVQGPLTDPALGEKSLRLLLKKHKYEDVQVRQSRVPIRF